jgi:hypothetical protein
LDTSSIYEHIEKELVSFNAEKSAHGAVHTWKWCGKLDAPKVHAITQELEQSLLDIGVQKQVQKRTFTILIEGLQNILKHSIRQDDHPLYGLALAYLNEKVDILLIGLADAAHIEKVTSLVADLNAMDASSIKEHYRFTMSHGKMSKKGGAGLGLITMVMKSDGGMKLSNQELTSGLYLLKSLTSAG